MSDNTNPPEERATVTVVCPRCKANHVATYENGVLVAYLILGGAKDCKPCAVLARLSKSRYSNDT